MESFTTLSKHISSLLLQATHEEIFPGAVIGVITKYGRVVIPAGHYTYDVTSQKMDENSMFDIASVTKTVPTALLGLKLIEEHTLDLHQKVHTILPRFRGKWKEQVTVWHLLTHTVDFGLQLSRLKNSDPDTILQTILNADLQSPPGKTYAYTNSTSIILGIIVETKYGMKLDEIAQKRFFDPLEMTSTTFQPPSERTQEIVPTEIDPWRGREIRGEVHDESAYTLSKTSVVGSAGLFSTVPDLLNVLEMILSNGVFHKKQILTEKIIEMMSSNQLAGIGLDGGLGWEWNKPYMGNLHSGKMIGKTGFTGCLIAADLIKGIGIVFLSNYHYPKRKKDRKPLDTIRREVIDSTFQAL